MVWHARGERNERRILRFEVYAHVLHSFSARCRFSACLHTMNVSFTPSCGVNWAFPCLLNRPCSTRPFFNGDLTAVSFFACAHTLAVVALPAASHIRRCGASYFFQHACIATSPDPLGSTSVVVIGNTKRATKHLRACVWHDQSQRTRFDC